MTIEELSNNYTLQKALLEMNAVASYRDEIRGMLSKFIAHDDRYIDTGDQLQYVFAAMLAEARLIGDAVGGLEFIYGAFMTNAIGPNLMVSIVDQMRNNNDAINAAKVETLEVTQP